VAIVRFVDQYQILRTHSESLWGATTRVEWPNEKLDPEPDATERWLRFTIVNNGTIRKVGSTSRWRAEGAVIVQVFGPPQYGAFDNLATAETVAAIFQEPTGLSDIWFRGPGITDAGRSDAWWQHNVTAPFTHTWTAVA